MVMRKKKWFFGWTNIKWFITELVNLYTGKPSYFSKKRIESSLAFLGGYWIVLYHAWSCRETITNSEIIADATLLFVIAGYTVRQIQSEKKTIDPNSTSSEITSTIEKPSSEEAEKEEDKKEGKEDGTEGI